MESQPKISKISPPSSSPIFRLGWPKFAQYDPGLSVSVTRVLGRWMRKYSGRTERKKEKSQITEKVIKENKNGHKMRKKRK